MSKHDSARFAAHNVVEKCEFALQGIKTQRQRDLEKEKARWLKQSNTKFRVALRFGKLKTDADAERHLDAEEGFHSSIRSRIGYWRYGEDERLITSALKLAQVAEVEAIGREVILSAKTSSEIEYWMKKNV